MKRVLLFSIFCIGCCVTVFAKDFGMAGHVFNIKEKNLLEAIQEKLNALEASGELLDAQRAIQEKINHHATHPKPVASVNDAQEDRHFYFDPTVTVPFDLKDHKGKIFFIKGQKVNPLDMLPMHEVLYFINGENETQLEWVKQRITSNSLIILTKGVPHEVHEAIGETIYFDQGGELVKKLGIKAVPAKVSQYEKKLKIEEIALRRGEND